MVSKIMSRDRDAMRSSRLKCHFSTNMGQLAIGKLTTCVHQRPINQKFLARYLELYSCVNCGIFAKTHLDICDDLSWTKVTHKTEAWQKFKKGREAGSREQAWGYYVPEPYLRALCAFVIESRRLNQYHVVLTGEGSAADEDEWDTLQRVPKQVCRAAVRARGALDG